MHCPFCSELDTRVIDSRLTEDGTQVRRRRECTSCNERFTTYEAAELAYPRIIKRDGSRVAFDMEKLRGGILRSLEKRPVASDDVEKTIAGILHRLRASGEREVSTELLGDWVMDALRELDDVAYVRFASVYRRFTDVDAFRKEIQKLEENN